MLSVFQRRERDLAAFCVLDVSGEAGKDDNDIVLYSLDGNHLSMK
jgi:hypothetical protein